MDLSHNLDKLNELRSYSNSCAKNLILSLFDEGSFNELDQYMVSDAVVTGYGKINGQPVFAYSQNIEAMSGAVTPHSVKKILKLYDLALKTGAPVVGMFDSFGVKLDEGVAALSAYGEWMAFVNNLSGVVPQISLIMGTCAGCAAVIACSADIVIMKKDAKLILNSSLSSDIGSTEDAIKTGSVHIVCNDDNDIVKTARDIACMLPQNNLSATVNFEFSEPESILMSDNIVGINLIETVVDKESVIELQKGFGDCVITALATLAGRVVGCVFVDGNICDNGALKAARFVRMCDAFAIPIVTFMGANSVGKLNNSYSIRSMACVAHAYAEVTVAKISVVTDESFGLIHLAFAGKASSCDLSIAWSCASISLLSPLTSVELLWHDKLKGNKNLDVRRNELADEFKTKEASPFKAAQDGDIDIIIKPEETRQVLISALDMAVDKRVKKQPKKHGNMPF